MGDTEESIKSSGSESQEEGTPSKKARFDFFTELKKLKEEGVELTIKDLSPGKIWNQEIKVAISWTDRDPQQLFTFHGFDGKDFIVFKAFKDLKQKYFEKIEAFRTYTFSNFTVSKNDPKYRKIFDTDLQIIVNHDTEFRVNEAGMKIQVPINPISIECLKDVAEGCVVDIIGLLVRVGNLVKTKNGRDTRPLSLVDQTLKETVTIDIWNQDAVDFTAEIPCPIAFRKVIKKGDNLLWVNALSMIEISDEVDPDNKLMKWYNQLVK